MKILINRRKLAVLALSAHLVGSFCMLRSGIVACPTCRTKIRRGVDGLSGSIRICRAQDAQFAARITKNDSLAEIATNCSAIPLYAAGAKIMLTVYGKLHRAFTSN